MYGLPIEKRAVTVKVPSERLATVLQTPKSFSRDLRDSRKHQKVFRGTCGVPGIRRDVCAGRASIPAFAETFAQVARGSRHLPRRLRRLRKFHGIYRDVCAGRARLPAFAETFAQAARGSRHLPRRLRRLREAPGIRRDVCGAPANAKKFFGTLAAFLQTPKSFSRLLQHSRKHQKVFQGTCGAPAKAKAKRERAAGLVFPCTLSALRLLYGWMDGYLAIFSSHFNMPSMTNMEMRQMVRKTVQHCQMGILLYISGPIQRNRLPMAVAPSQRP